MSYISHFYRDNDSIHNTHIRDINKKGLTHNIETAPFHLKYSILSIFYKGHSIVKELVRSAILSHYKCSI
jgi:hypothetical protein